MTIGRSKQVSVLALVMLFSLVSSSHGQDEVAKGRELYLQHCAACHGVEADGHGPLARELRKQPSDLRALSLRYGNPLPADQIARFMDGRADVAAHGPRDMPVWGEEMWQYPEGSGKNPNQVSDSVAAIIRYLQSIQISKRHALVQPRFFPDALADKLSTIYLKDARYLPEQDQDSERSIESRLRFLK